MLGFWREDIKLFDIVPFNSIVVDKAAELIESHGTRTLDAIQMGSALVLNRTRSSLQTDKCFKSLIR